MPWVKLAEDFYAHPKVTSVGPTGIALFVGGLCYANQYLTDGYLPLAAVEIVAATTGVRTVKATAAKLVAAELWEPADDGWRIHDYFDYQPSKQAVMAEREAARERMARARKARHPPPNDPDVRPNIPRTPTDVRPNFDRSSPEVRSTRPVPNVPTEHYRARARDRAAPRAVVENQPPPTENRRSCAGCPDCHGGWTYREDGTVEPCQSPTKAQT